MRSSLPRLMVSGLTLVGFSLALPSWAEEPSVITPDQLEAAKAVERNTYHNEEYGFSITKPEEWTFGQGVLKGLTPTLQDIRATPLVAMVRFPATETWVLVNPRVMVDVFHDVTPPLAAADLEGISGEMLRLLQGKPGAAVNVSLPPEKIQVNGNVWFKAGMFARFPFETNPQQPVDCYIELYFHITGNNRMYVVQFISRPADVPTYRHDVDRMIQSIAITESTPTTGQPGTKVEL